MGKSKKDKRSRQEEGLDDDLVTQTSAMTLNDDAGDEASKVTNGTQKQKKKDKKKKGKRKDDLDESEEEEEDDGIAALAKATGQSTGNSKAKAGFSAFQMLQDDDNEDDGSQSESEEEEEKPVMEDKQKDPKTEEMEAEAVSQKTKKKKGKKGKQPEKEEDIDAILAEIEKPAEKTDRKKKKTKQHQQEESVVETTEPVNNDQDAGPKLIDFSAMTQEEIAAMFDDEDDEEEEKKKKKKKKKEKKGGEEEQDADIAEADKEEVVEEGEGDGDSTVKTTAQKKKEKKERQRLQKLQEKQKQKDKGEQKKEEKQETKEVEVKEESEEKLEAGANKASEEKDMVEEGEDQKGSDDDEEEGDKKKKKRDRRKKKDDKEKEKDVPKKKPGKGQLKVIQELQQKVKEEEERFKREEEEKERRIEEARIIKEEEDKKKQEKKDKEKQKKKERVERAKAEGRYMSAKQKEAQKRAQQLLEAVQARGVQVPIPGQAPDDRPKKKPIYTKKKKPQQRQQLPSEESQETSEQPESTSEPPSAPETPQEEDKPLIEEVQQEQQKEDEKAAEELKDAWDVSSDEEDQVDNAVKAAPVIEVKIDMTEKEKQDKEKEEKEEEEEEEEEESEESSEEESSEEESSDESSSEDEKLTPAEKYELKLQKAREKIQKRKETNEGNRSTDNLRAPVVCVLGHVDTGKTKILDKLRRTHVQDGEAGGITQQIGATNVPSDCIQEQTKMIKEFTKKELKVPGLLIIDTPGHESFSNLRNRGSGLCDIAILVIDIMHGIEPQTLESINLLKSRKTPFIVALNKIDRLYGWQSNPHADVQNTIKKLKPNTKMEFDERTQSVIVQLAEQGLNAALFFENKNQREYISLVPTSAHSGDGIGNLIAMICELCQSMLAKRLAYSEELQAVAMEVKAIPGLGTTVDVILVNGKMKEGQTIVMAGTEGPIVTQIRGLLMPEPLRELRVKNAYTKNKEVLAAQGIKVIAKDMEKALAGFPVYIADNQDEVEVYRQEIEQVITDVLDSIKIQEKGVYVQASTLGSLEALLEFLKTSKIPFAGINIGPVHKKDVMKASTMLERESQYAVILAFDVKVERDAQEIADSVGLRIFTADIIYHLFDAFMGYREELKRQKQEEFKHIAVFPCKLKIMPNCVFNSRDPIVVGVQVEAGFIKEGTQLCVPNKQFIEIGRVSSIEFNHKAVDIAKKGNEVCIKIDAIPGDAPKMVGRHFEETDHLVSKITRQSIDVVKEYFRDEMSKNDWQLIMELKKTFSIL